MEKVNNMGKIVIIIIGIGIVAGIASVVDNGAMQISELAGNTFTCMIGLIVVLGAIMLFIRSFFPHEEESTDGNTSGVRPIPNQGQPYEILEQGKDNAGRPYFIIKASNYYQAGKLTEGWKYPGDGTWAYTKIGRNKWNVHFEDWDISFPSKQ